MPRLALALWAMLTVFLTEAGAYVLDVANVQPKLGLEGAFLSALMVERAGESKDERLERLERFLARHAKGWDRHVLHERRQRDIVVQTTGQKPAFDAYADRGILLAGEWVLSEHTADAAAATGKLCGQNIHEALFTVVFNAHPCASSLGT